MYRFIASFSYTLAIVILCNSNVFSQWNIGGRLGTHLPKQEYAGSNEDTIISFKSDAPIFGFEAGILAERKLKWGLSIRSEINFIQKGGKFTSNNFYKANELEGGLSLNYNYIINDILLFANIGSFAGYIVNAKFINDDMKRDYSDFKRIDYGFLFGGGVGYKLGNGLLFLESRYRHSFSYFTDQSLESFRFTIKNFGIGLNLGYSITISKKKVK